MSDTQKIEKKYYFSESDDKAIEELGGSPKTAKKVMRMLWDKPRTITEMAKELQVSYEQVRKHVDLLSHKVTNSIVKIPLTNYYRLANRTYIYDYEHDPIDKIPRCYFRKIPVIERWFNLSLNNPKRLGYISTFERICYGELVPGFKVNPSNWNHPESLEEFYTEYKKHHGHELFEYIVNALRAFYKTCLRMTLSKSESEYYGLVVDNRNKGKHKHLRFTNEELESAKAWLMTKEAEILARDNGLSIEGLRAHFAFSVEAFPRPSRCLTIETAKINRYDDHLRFKMWETKQSQFYPKFVVLDKTLVDWAWLWVQHRIEAKRKYLFLDDNDYIPKPYDRHELDEDREPYRNCYRDLFKAVGKTEPICFERPLYTLRHVGAMRWMDKLGPNGIFKLTKMGWQNPSTLLTFYSDFNDESILSELT